MDSRISTHKIHNDYDWTAECNEAEISELMPYARDSSALAFALTSLAYHTELMWREIWSNLV